MNRVLVTGVGAIIGYGIIRSLRQSDENIFILGADIYQDAVGQAWSDSFVQAPLTNSQYYSDWLKSTIKQYNLDLIIPGIEQDVHFFSDNRNVFDSIGTKIVLNNQKLINITKDKWHIDQELVKFDSQVRIPSYLNGSFEFFADTLGVPFILKPRSGYASKGIVYVENKKTFDFHAEKIGSFLLVQPIVGSKDEEYTVAVFGNGKGDILSTITLQRKLAPDGSTIKAKTCDHESLNIEVKKLVKHFLPLGPTNLQFRSHKDGWRLLEINPRLSSSTSLRTAFGYNESLMSIDYFLTGKEPTQPCLKHGSAVRYIEDYVVYDRDNS